jgi:cytochrome c5
MIRVLHWVLIVAIVGLSGCSPDSDDLPAVQAPPTGAQQARTQAAGQEYQDDSWRERYLALGRDTYEQVCASCHDENTDGAPVTGDRDSWSNRSPLWAAVLFEHAKSGHLDMPAKGGHPELTERAVEAAGEYMLSETFPELPRD